MGQPYSKRKPSARKDTPTWRGASWLYTRRGILTSFGLTSPPAAVTKIPPDNIFVTIQEDNILPQIPIGRHHPVLRKGIEDDDNRTLNTNKFYANAFLGEQDQPIWTQPYSVWWGKGREEIGLMKTWGVCVSHIDEGDLELSKPRINASQRYTNPPNKQSIMLSARELDQQTYLTTDTHLPFSVNINLNTSSHSQRPVITFPVVQGMSFVTAGYRDAMPTIQTDGRGFVDVVGPISMGRPAKFRVKDMDGRDWLIYIIPISSSNYDPTRFFKLDPNTIIGAPGFVGTIQVAKNPLGAEGEAIYDRAFGSFVYEAKLTAVVNDARGSYAFNYNKVGTSPLLMFALAHHIQSLDLEQPGQITKLQLRTTTKGMATAVWAERLSFTESGLPVTMHFAPWVPTMGANAKPRHSAEVLALIAAVAERDLRRVLSETFPPDSTCYVGKTLAKFATILWVIKDMLMNETLAFAGLYKLKQELDRYIANQQMHPLYYDDTWKGVVSNAGFHDPAADFGNTYYNDHHIHFSYFVYTAAIIGYLDPLWLKQGDNKAWTNMLVKDFAESDYNGRDYPFSRSFDWWSGNSWSKGLFESSSGKGQERTGEDGFASFAIKMWGKKRGNLMLAIQARSFANYVYLRTSNQHHPAHYNNNKIAGTLSENKVEYTTSVNLTRAHIHGLHMVPITPATAYLRPRAFAKEEWEYLVSKAAQNPNSDNANEHNAVNIEGGWRGIFYANLALFDPKASYAFFRDGVNGFWDERWIDGGASRTWYLVWAAGLGEGLRRYV
ncbi:endo-1,3(4)-beta-glucanase 1 precursor [Phaeosphaeriaceae sp. PMI808]|nr:endo-1,3(4)-beta-glucanase 1 precursor [Phaeosphaeriaceae sp. PMI808]